MDIIPKELWQEILNLTPLKTQLNMIQLNKFFRDNLQIWDFYHMEREHSIKLTSEILMRYPHIKYYNSSFVTMYPITDINFMTNLEILDASVHSHINDAGISQLKKIKKLDISWNRNITSINHLTNLVELKAICNCGIKNDSIKKLNLQILDMSWNRDITEINHMSNLKELYINGPCGINDGKLVGLNISKLIANENPRLYDLNHMINLKELSVCCNAHESGVGDNGIRQLNLEKLTAHNNIKITDVSHMTNLKEFNQTHGIGYDTDEMSFEDNNQDNQDNQEETFVDQVYEAISSIVWQTPLLDGVLLELGKIVQGLIR